ncbi:MAG: hypothetical protein V3R65_11315 [Acidiferrobacterales bacterium]
MIPGNVKHFAFLLLLTLPAVSLAGDWQYSGHIKYQAAINLYDATSLFGSGGTVAALDQDANLRLKAEKRDGSWDYRIHYEIGVLYGNTLEALRSIPLPFGSYGLPNDNNRLLDLTATIYDEGRAAAVHRFDRASMGYAKDNFVFRGGRDAVSWGNGLVFQPMDIFNPFSPTAVDKEYKPGDDMLYAQWLFANGNDLQLVAIPRRNSSSIVDVASSSLATKYRVRFGNTDTDVLLARHYDENLVGLGAASDWSGAVVRGDITATATSNGTVISGVANINYSWSWAKHNVSGFVEYYRNGFGLADGDYSTVASNAALIARLNRGELFNVGRDYIVGGLTVELAPRWQFSPSLIWNLNDGSALWQFGASFDWKQNASILLGGIVPIGPQGTEFGGIPLGGGQFFRPPTSVYGRVSHYF